MLALAALKQTRSWISHVKHEEVLVSVTRIQILLNLFMKSNTSEPGWDGAWRNTARSGRQSHGSFQQLKLSDEMFTPQICSVVSFAEIHFRLTVRCIKGRGREKSKSTLFLSLLSKRLRKASLDGILQKRREQMKQLSARITDASGIPDGK